MTVKETAYRLLLNSRRLLLNYGICVLEDCTATEEETDHKYTLSSENQESCDILGDLVSCLWRKGVCLYVKQQLGSLNDF